jgi:hypothetical protein
MAWTYSGDPASSTKDAVRFHVQDVIEADPQVNDEEIEYLLTSESSDVLRAAARTAETIAAKYARQVDKSVGGLSLSAGRRQEHYMTLAQNLWSKSKTVGGQGLPVPYAGGISEADKLQKAQDPDRVDPFFRRDLQDFETLQPLTSPDTL